MSNSTETPDNDPVEDVVESSINLGLWGFYVVEMGVEQLTSSTNTNRNS
jgi:hypothetical protein